VNERFETWLIGWHPEAELAKTDSGIYRNHTVRAQLEAFRGGVEEGKRIGIDTSEIEPSVFSRNWHRLEIGSIATPDVRTIVAWTERGIE
jgi:hypothetical protein